MERKALHDKVRRSCPFTITDSAAREAVSLLRQLNYLEIDENGICHFDFKNLKTALELDNQAIKLFHYQNLRFAMEAISWTVDKRFFTNASIPCDDALYEQLKIEIRELCSRFLKLAEERMDKANCSKVTSIQFAVFPYFSF